MLINVKIKVNLVIYFEMDGFRTTVKTKRKNAKLYSTDTEFMLLEETIQKKCW